MIEIIEGRGVGAGKSYYVVTRVIRHIANGGTVYFSDTLDLIPEKIIELITKRHGVIAEPSQMVAVSREDVWRIHEVTPPGTDEMPVLIILDEVQRALNARDHMDKRKRALFDWACESRHDSNDLIFISQNALNIDNQVRRLVTYITRVRNMVGFKFGGFSWPFKQFLIHIFDGDGKTSMEKKLIWHDKQIFGCYRTKSMKGSHTRLFGEGIAKRNLQKVKPPKHMKYLVLMFVLIAITAVGLGYKVYRRGNPLVTTPIPTQSLVTTGTSGNLFKRVPNKWSVKSETFRGCMPGVLRTAESGEYVEGEMTPNGFCEQVRGTVAKLRGVDGDTVYVVAIDKIDPKGNPQTVLTPPLPLETSTNQFIGASWEPAKTFPISAEGPVDTGPLKPNGLRDNPQSSAQSIIPPPRGTWAQQARLARSSQ